MPPAKPTQPRWPSDTIHEVKLAHDRYWRRWSTYWHCFDSPEAKAFWRACASDGSTYTAAEFAADDLQRAKWALDDLRMLLRLMEADPTTPQCARPHAGGGCRVPRESRRTGKEG